MKKRVIGAAILGGLVLVLGLFLGCENPSSGDDDDKGGGTFVAVTGITGVPEKEFEGIDLTLTGTVAPYNATNQTIVWTVKEAGTTGASISSGILSTTAAGTVELTATIENGAAAGTPYTQDFDITISPLPVIPAYAMITVPAGEVTTANTGTGANNRWYAGSRHPKPFTVNEFLLGETEITYELWRAVYLWAINNARGAAKYTFANAGREGHDGVIGAASETQEPVTTISWRDMVVWCNAYSDATGKTPVYKYGGDVLRESEGDDVAMGSGKAEQAVIDSAATGFRLPTEGEWEYAARGGVPSTTTPWTYVYAGSTAADDVAVYNTEGTAEVKSKTGGTYNGANSLGFYDMSGNVWEWCSTGHQSPTYTGNRMRRGGGYLNSASQVKVAWDGRGKPQDVFDDVGFRVACLP